MAKPMKIEKWQASSRWIPSDEVLVRIDELGAKIGEARDYRERQKHAKMLAFCCTSVAVSETEFVVEDLARIIAAGQTARRYGGATDLLGRSLLHLVRRRLDLLGVGEPTLVAEKKKRVTWDGGCIAVGADSAVVRNAMPAAESEIASLMNAGAFYMVSLGGDGTASLTLRVIEFVEPMLPTNEFAKTEAISEPSWLQVENRELLAGPAEAMEKGVRLSVRPGRYAVRLFSVGARLVFVICLSSATTDDLRSIPSL